MEDRHAPCKLILILYMYSILMSMILCLHNQLIDAALFHSIWSQLLVFFMIQEWICFHLKTLPYETIEITLQTGRPLCRTSSPITPRDQWTNFTKFGWLLILTMPQFTTPLMDPYQHHSKSHPRWGFCMDFVRTPVNHLMQGCSKAFYHTLIMPH